MSQIDDGSPAFPRPGSEYNYCQEGMTLRDWFAGQALAHIGSEYFANGEANTVQAKRNAVTLALHAYNIADAMLAARLTERK